MDKIYDKAWKLLGSEDRWTKFSAARTEDGTECAAMNPDAVRWCTLGAMEKVYGVNIFHKCAPLYSILGSSVSEWNDTPNRKHLEIVEFLKERDL